MIFTRAKVRVLGFAQARFTNVVLSFVSREPGWRRLAEYSEQE
jgi:hypothetical protein